MLFQRCPTAFQQFCGCYDIHSVGEAMKQQRMLHFLPLRGTEILLLWWIARLGTHMNCGMRMINVINQLQAHSIIIAQTGHFHRDLICLAIC